MLSPSVPLPIHAYTGGRKYTGYTDLFSQDFFGTKGSEDFIKNFLPFSSHYCKKQYT